MQLRVPTEFTYNSESRATVSEVAKSLVAQEKLFRDAILVLEECFPQLTVDGITVVVREVTQNSPMRHRLEGVLAAAFQEGLMDDMPVDLIQTLFGYDVPDSYDSFVSLLILIIALWGAERVIKRLRRMKDDAERGRLERREDEIAAERRVLTENAAQKLHIPQEQLVEALNSVLTKRPVAVSNQSMDFLGPARRHRATSISTAGDAKINTAAIEALPSDAEMASYKPPTQTDPFECVVVKFFAHDRENPKRWAAAIADITEERKALHLAPDIDAESLFTRDMVRADVLVTYVLDAEGVYQPTVYYLSKVYDD